MLARANIAANSVSHQRAEKAHEKTDEELIEELEAERQLDDGLGRARDPLAHEEGSFLRSYLVVAQYSRLVTEDDYEWIFNIVIIGTIVMAAVLVGIQTYDQFEGNATLFALENFVMAIFTLEVILKVVSEGADPLRYFTGPEGSWNIFDFIITVVTWVSFGIEISVNSNTQVADRGREIAVIRFITRIARLIRLAKIIKKIPPLQVIVKGLVGGLSGISFIGILLLLIFYVFAVAGCFLFRENDPFHFGDVGIALLTMFKMTTMDNWTGPMSINYYGCDTYNGDIYATKAEYEASASPALGPWEDYPKKFKCTHPVARPVEATIYNWIFIVMSGLVMISLFVGVVTMSMQNSMLEMRQDIILEKRKQALQRATKNVEEISAIFHASSKTDLKAAMAEEQTMLDAKAKDASSSSSSSSSSNVVNRSVVRRGGDAGLSPVPPPEASADDQASNTGGTVGVGANTGGRESPVNLRMRDREKLRDIRQMKFLLMQAWHGTAATDDHNAEFDLSQSAWDMDRAARKIALKARDVIISKWFNNFITIVIVLTGAVVGVEASFSEDEITQQARTALNVIEWFIFVIFASEIFIRLAAEEFYLLEYFKDKWNIFDNLVVWGSLVDFGGNQLLVMLRLLRLLRVLKLVKALPQLALIVNALIMGTSSIGFIGVIILLCIYMFGILGNLLFKANDAENFGDLHRCFITLMRVATLDNWDEIMYKNMYGCKYFPVSFYADEFDADSCDWSTSVGRPAVSAIYFVFYVLIAAYVLFTLFVGVVTTSMEEAGKNQDVEHEMESQVRKICVDSKITSAQMDIYRRVFAMLDLDGGGTIDAKELRTGLRCVNIFPSDAQLMNYVYEIDLNSDGEIDLVEFVVFMTNMKEKNQRLKEERLAKKREREIAKGIASGRGFGNRMSGILFGGGSSTQSIQMEGADGRERDEAKNPHADGMLSRIGRVASVTFRMGGSDKPSSGVVVPTNADAGEGNARSAFSLAAKGNKHTPLTAADVASDSESSSDSELDFQPPPRIGLGGSGGAAQAASPALLSSSPPPIYGGKAPAPRLGARA
jgi:Ca2+-binding EF-hand superfamily protein